MKIHIRISRWVGPALALFLLSWSIQGWGATANLLTETFNSATVGTLTPAAAPAGVPGADLTSAPYSAGWTYAQQGATITGTKAVADLGGGNRVVQVSGRASAGETDQFFTNEGSSGRTWSTFSTMSLKCRVLFLEATTGQNNSDFRLIATSNTSTPNGPGFQLNADSTTGGYIFRVGVYTTGTGNFVSPAPTVIGAVQANKVYEITTTFANGAGSSTDITYHVRNVTDSVDLVAQGSGNVAVQLAGATSMTYIYARVASRMNGWFDQVVLDNITAPPAGVEQWNQY